MWTLYCPNGRAISFYIKGCAELYKNIWGGTIVYEIGRNSVDDPHLPQPAQKAA